MDSASLPQPYPAAKLDLHLRQIRLVSILPGRYVDIVACDLSTASVDDLPDYYSLSYTWGDRTNPRQILLNGVPFNVTRNLEAALRRLRLPTQPRIFWIDMICISQECVEERSHQVNLMQIIYSGTKEVFLWFGDYEETTLQETNQSLPSEEGQEGFTQIEAIRALGYIEKHSTDQHFLFPTQGASFLRLRVEICALNKFMNCSWWHRIWTVQEVILPFKVTIIVGWLKLSWNTLAVAVDRLYEHNYWHCCRLLVEYGPTLQTFAQRVHSIQVLRTSHHQGDQLSLEILLHAFRNRLSTDPRDKIFGLLGLVMRNPEYRTLKAEYTLSVAVVYQQIFMYLFQEAKNVNFLIRQPEMNRTLNLPTWMPDWTAQVDELEMGVHLDVRIILPHFDTSGSTKSHICWPCSTKSLGIKGLLFDEVDIIPERLLDRKYISREYLRTLFHILESQMESYAGGEDIRHAFWRLVSMDLILDTFGEHKKRVTRRTTIKDYREHQNDFESSGDAGAGYNFLSAFRFFISKKGYIGLGPDNMEVGDTVHVFLGGSVPFVLRETKKQPVVFGKENSYEFIGNCYVQGIMDGEALQGVDLDNLDWINLE